MSSPTASLTPAAVSALLRRGGLNPLGSGTPASHEGIRVKRAALPGVVTIVVDTDSPTITERLTADAQDLCRAAGLLVAVNPLNAAIFSVAR